MHPVLLQLQNYISKNYYNIVNNLDKPFTQNQTNIFVIVLLLIICSLISWAIIAQINDNIKEYFFVKRVFDNVTPLKAIEDDSIKIVTTNKKYFFKPKKLKLFLAIFLILAVIKTHTIFFSIVWFLVMYLIAVFYNKYKKSFYKENLESLKFLYWFSFIFGIYVLLMA